MPEARSDVEITLSQKIIRADGTVEDLGVVASTADGSVESRRPLWVRLPRPQIRKDR